MRTRYNTASGVDAPGIASVSPRCASLVRSSFKSRGKDQLLAKCNRTCRRAALSEALLIRALDAPMPFDFEHKAKNIIAKRKQLRIGIVGFGTFGQFLAGRLVAAGHQVSARQATHDHNIAASRWYKHSKPALCLPHVLPGWHAGLSNLQDELC